MVGYLRAHVADYADPAGTSQFPGPYSGAVGKLALVAEITGQDPHSFGGFDLLKLLTGHVCSAADRPARAPHQVTSTNHSRLFRNRWRCWRWPGPGLTPPAAAVSRLESLQCRAVGSPPS